MAATFGTFLKELKAYSSATAVATEDVASVLRRANSGVSTVDDAIKALRVTTNSQRTVLIGGQTVGEVHTILRQGNLRRLLQISSSNLPFNSIDDAAFKSVVGNTPERGVLALETASIANRQRYPHMDATASEIDLLPATGKADVAKAESNLTKNFATGTKIALTTGVIVVGADWIVKATRSKEGCNMVTMINNKLTSCKVQAYSCTDYADQGDLCTQSFSYYNVTLVLMTLAEYPNTNEQKMAIAQIAGVNVEDFSKRLTTIIDTKFPEVSEEIRKWDKKPMGAPCQLTHPDIDGGKVPKCRMCSPSAAPTTTQFIDPTQYGDNITFVCTINPSILDTITDAAITTGRNLFDGIGSGLSKLLRPIGIIAAIIIAVIIVVVIVAKVLPKKHPDTEVLVAPSPSASIYASTETLLPSVYN